MQSLVKIEYILIFHPLTLVTCLRTLNTSYQHVQFSSQC